MSKKNKKLLAGALILTTMPLHSANPQITPTCIYDKPVKEDYIITNFDTALSGAAEDAAKKVSASLALDLIFVKSTITASFEAADLPIPSKINDLADGVLEKFKVYLEDQGSLVITKFVDNAKLKLNDAMKDKKPSLKAFGKYTFCEGDFSGGSWSAEDLIFDGDTGGSATVKGEAEFNAGASFLASGEFKVQIVMAGDVTLLMTSLASREDKSNANILTLDGVPAGKVTAGATLEVQAGLSAENAVGLFKNFSHDTREVVTITAIETDAVCK